MLQNCKENIFDIDTGKSSSNLSLNCIKHKSNSGICIALETRTLHSALFVTQTQKGSLCEFCFIEVLCPYGPFGFITIKLRCIPNFPI